MAPARKPDNEIALEPTPGGFGTPWFSHDGDEHRVRVEGKELVHDIGAEAQRAPLRSLASAGELVAGLLPAGADLDDSPLEVDVAGCRALADWYAFGRSALEALAAEASSEDDPSPAILWPEHFDLAVELGREDSGASATYGFSPGDEHHAEPYAYVGPWTTQPEGPLWQARGFRGAELGYAELLAADDELEAALDFLRARRDALTR